MGDRWVTDNQYQPSHGSSLGSGFQQQQGIRCVHHWPAHQHTENKAKGRKTRWCRWGLDWTQAYPTANLSFSDEFVTLLKRRQIWNEIFQNHGARIISNFANAAVHGSSSAARSGKNAQTLVDLQIATSDPPWPHPV